ncbi:phage virion morphogenesis protein [Larkinella sp. VNQ87]|uniref:phage virion morphogenesis protein n=1 Tax=Larkinella sp. VNQ87 TaxID=3400921 RepID=UPI003C03B8E4
MSPEDFKQAAKQAQAFIQNDVPRIVQVEGKKHFKQSFHNEGFTDVTLEKWPDISEKAKDRKRRKNGSLPPILTDTGNLGDSIDADIQPGQVVFGSDVPYAKRHNEGTNGTPKRQFMGPSKALDQKIIAKIERELKKIFPA